LGDCSMTTLKCNVNRVQRLYQSRLWLPSGDTAIHLHARKLKMVSAMPDMVASSLASCDVNKLVHGSIMCAASPLCPRSCPAGSTCPAASLYMIRALLTCLQQVCADALRPAHLVIDESCCLAPCTQTARISGMARQPESPHKQCSLLIIEQTCCPHPPTGDLCRR
jgi:hypothetical protein